MECNTEDFLNIMYLECQLVNATLEEFISEYQTKDMYALLIDTLNIMMDVDSGFFLLDSKFIERIEKVIYEERFKYKEKDFVDATNNVIVNLNKRKSYSKELKEQILNSYMAYHEELRELNFDDYQDLIYALGCDAIIYDCLRQEKIESDLEIKDEYFFGTINYLLNTIPEVYQDYNLKNATLEKLETILQKKKSPFSSVNKNIKKTITKLQTKKED